MPKTSPKLEPETVAVLRRKLATPPQPKKAVKRRDCVSPRYTCYYRYSDLSQQ